MHSPGAGSRGRGRLLLRVLQRGYRSILQTGEYRQGLLAVAPTSGFLQRPFSVIAMQRVPCAVRQRETAHENSENVSISLEYVVISVLLEMATGSELGTGSEHKVVNSWRFSASHP